MCNKNSIGASSEHDIDRQQYNGCSSNNNKRNKARFKIYFSDFSGGKFSNPYSHAHLGFIFFTELSWVIFGWVYFRLLKSTWDFEHNCTFSNVWQNFAYMSS